MCPGYLRSPYNLSADTDRIKPTNDSSISRHLISPRSAVSTDTQKRVKATPMTHKSAIFSETHKKTPLRIEEITRIQAGKKTGSQSARGAVSARKLIFVYPEEYLKEQEVEAEVSKLLSMDPTKSLMSQTYKAWKKRVAETGRMLLIDKLYARKICKARRFVQNESKATLKELQRFKEMIKAKTEEMVFKAEIEDRFAGKPSIETSEHVGELSHYTKFSKRRQEKLEQEYRFERTQEGIERVVQDSVNKMTQMTERIREHKSKEASSDLN